MSNLDPILFSAQSALLKASEDLHIRSEVSHVLSSLLTDVELYANLQNQFVHQKQIQNLKHILENQENELQERRAVYEASEQKNKLLADQFISEIFCLSVKMQELSQWKNLNFEKIETIDELKRDFDRAEETIRTLKRSFSLNTNAMRDPSVISDNTTSTPQKGATDTSATIHEVSDEDQKEKDDMVATNTPPNIEEKKSSTVDEEDNTKKMSLFTFIDFEEEILLEIFSFLDALEVIEAAQVNKAFYQKVNKMFGNTTSFDDEIATEEQVQGSVSEENNQATKIEENEQEAKTEASKSNNNSSQTTEPNSEPSAKNTSQRNPLAQMFTLLQPKNNNVNSASSVSSASTPATASTSVTSSTSDKNPPTTLTAQMANSMTSKLTPSELSIIINMTEKIKRVTAEREDLAARLESSESVKEFLINQKRDLELSVDKKTQELVRVRNQNASDQEVIAFLDQKVQSLEKELSQTKSSKQNLESHFSEYKHTSTQKIKVIEDMLQFERQQLSEQEKDWKNVKKVLVKEVKHCRAQVATLQAERDSFMHQNEKLKQVVMALPNGNHR